MTKGWVKAVDLDVTLWTSEWVDQFMAVQRQRQLERETCEHLIRVVDGDEAVCGCGETFPLVVDAE
jgi:hypothetical protein